MNFGMIGYHNIDIRDNPLLVTTALRIVEKDDPKAKFTFQGMLAGTDKFSRRTRMTDTSIQQLTVDIRGGVFSGLIGWMGSAKDYQGLVDIDIEGFGPNRYLEARYEKILSRIEDLSEAENLAIRLWSLFSVSCGMIVISEEDRKVASELTGIVFNKWPRTSEPTEEDNQEEKRLFAIQRLRLGYNLFGPYARAGWGTFLGPKFVNDLGGLERIRNEAPVAEVRSLPEGGVYLRLSTDPLMVESTAYRTAVEKLSEFLDPVLATVAKAEKLPST
ncbi:MAG: hypothetical protein LBG44_06300 [Gemmatimonadota bacterium]|jgi:hypothetical protein|nr:hypothetical protein [Gemmatimonadota bacterium]